MRTTRRVIGFVVLAIVLVQAPGEAAGVLTTAAVHRAGNAFGCLAVNAGSQALTVVIEVMKWDGSALLGPAGVNLPPGQVSSLGVGSGFEGDTLYCRFTVTDGNRLAVRGSYCVADGDAFTCKATGEAR